ncbi:hypothetical protein E1176_01325, partial [Fulvivirga sp. RKSG066]|uniref:carboxypeptidase-like regulatory domain-containing protein n=1 Tax=Fulvivirga aurantia TaxID=2529383 RepID=UPI0012BD09FD
MNILKLFSVAILLLVGTTLYAQKGTIRGSVIDNTTGEPLFGVTAVIAGTTTGAASDFDGKFEIQIEPGTY